VISIGTNPFSDCSNLAQIIVDSGNTVYDSRESCNAIIKTNTNKLITGCKNTVIPNTVTSIESWAFYGSNSLISVVIPNSVISIGTNPFARCSGLAQIIVDSGNTVYDSREGCNAIIKSSTNELVLGCKNTTIPNTVTSIGSNAFYYCYGLTSITIPNSVTNIGSSAFYYCTGLTSMTILAETPPTLVGNYVFYYVNKSNPMYVPCASLLAYQSTTGWNEFSNYMPATTCESGEIIVTINPSGCGTVTGAGYYDGGAVCTLTATANTGYSFINWTRDGVVVSNSETYSFFVTGDASFVANFGHGVIVHDGTSTNGYVPIYGFFTDAYLKSEAVYPASELSTMNGKSITNMKFYASQSDVNWGAANFQVFLTEVDHTTISDFNGPGIVVYEGVLSIVNGVMEIDFSNPYHYNGGNLLVGVYNTVKGTFVTSSWYGESVTGASVQGYSYSGLDAISATQRNFLPKTMFLYVDEIQPTYVVSAVANPAYGGTVTGAGTYEEGDACTLIATPNEGFSFCSWMENDTVVSYSPTYTFTVDGDRNLVANFGNCPSTCNVIFELYDSYGDGWNGASLTVAFSDGTPMQNLTIHNGASAIYTIEIGNGVHISLTWHSGSWDNEVSFIVRYEDGTIIFQQGSVHSGLLYEFDCVCPFQYYYSILTMSNPQMGGILIGDGYYEEGDTCTLVAIPNEGYLFDNWTNQGNIVSDSTTYSFIVTENATYVANFVEKPVLDTTIYIDICYGEDYVENGFEIFYPEVGIGNYSLMFHPSFEYDSIVNLTLTVYPTYYFAVDTTLCNASSYTWHGNTYTESGTYYDSLQTIHGCDSIYALSLEFFNTPLGEFTIMNPTNNYPFSSLPITFSWDAVSGAEYYNLYLWNVNEPTPSTPYASNIYNRSCYVPSLQNHQTYNWYVEAVNTCFTTTSSVRSFSLNIPPSMNVSASSLNFGEVALNNSNTLNLYVSGNALDDTITMQISGEDASMFSFEQGSNWNGLTGGLLSVTFSPTAVQYNYTANLVISAGTLTQTVQLTGSLADMFVFNTYVTQDVFEMNSTVPIYGTVMDASNNPASFAEVEVKVTVMNMTRSLFATTGADGHFSVEFVPAYSESGYYTINSGRVGHNSTAVHDDFNIPGMNLVTNDWILWDVVQNETSIGSIVIRNRSQIPLNNIQVTANTLPEGCSFAFQPLSLQGMEEGVLEYSVSGTTPTNGYQEVNLVATSSEGASLNFTVWYRCAEPRGILYASPNNITTTMTKGKNKIVDVMLYNNGTGPTGSVYLDLPSVDWLSVVGNDTLPSIAVQDSAYFSLRLSANENTPLVQYTGNIAINCERGDGLLLPYTIMAVSDSTGTLIVDVTDDYTYNGNGQHLGGATVTVKGYYSLETVAIGLTDSNGLFTVSDIPEGYYRMSITAPHHAEYQATIQIEGGQTNTQNIYLQYQAITYSWNVVPTEIQDEYTFELIVEYETNVPVPVVVIDMPQTFPELAEGESFVFDYIISNLGLVDTYDATLYPPTNHPLYDFTPLVTEIDTLHAQTSVVIPCTMTVRTGQRSPLVYAALNGRGERDDDCPDMAKTEVWSYYYCNGEKVYVKGYKYVQIGSHPCETPPSSGGGGGIPGGGGSGGGGGHLSGSGGSGTPPVTTQQQGCSEDPNLPGALEGAMGGLGGCPPPSDGTPKLPPQPGNNRRKNN
jgi:hypothetical protein